jgi:hypothetical protein
MGPSGSGARPAVFLLRTAARADIEPATTADPQTDEERTGRSRELS